jgi:hypothetical protein
MTFPTRRALPSALRAAVVLMIVVVPMVTACADTGTTTPTSLVPLVPAGALPVSTVAPSTTAAPSSDPNSPLIAAVPEIDCAYADLLPGGEITFVVGDRLYGAAPDGTVLRCLANLRADQRGPVKWSPDGTRAVLNAATVYDGASARFTGFDVANTRVQWEWPTATGMFAPTASNRTLVRRDAVDPNVRTEITFLADTVAAVAHPAGGVVIASGTAADGTAGIYVATDTGDSTRMLVSTAAVAAAGVDAPAGTGARVTELGADAAGDMLYFLVENGTSFKVEQLVFGDLSVTELSSEQAPIVQLTVGPTRRSVAWKVGLCNSITQTRVRDDRTATAVDVGIGTPIEPLSIAPVGWLDGSRLVVATRPLGCDGPADVWIWNLLDSSATLLAKTVEFAAVRTTPEGAAPLTIAPEAVPAVIP